MSELQVESDARRWTTVDPADPLGWFTLAGALRARGRPLPAIEEVLRKQEALGQIRAGLESAQKFMESLEGASPETPGEKSADRPPRRGGLPKGRLATVPDCGHSIYFEHPEIFNQIVRDFLIEIGYAPTRN